jgi:type I restriction enzyme S subunit
MIEVKVAEGYKQTEVGVIPKDWQVKDIGEALTIKHGKDQKQVESAHGQYPIFGTGGQMGWANDFLYNRPSVLIGRKGSINKPRYINVPFWTVDTLFYSQVHNGYDEKFMFYKFCLIDWMNYNEASGVPSLNASTISNVKISVPEKQEQTAIATALSDVDDLIQSLEKLIAKKEAIKTGTMQQLLTGKARLPEFATRDDGSAKGFKQTELGWIPEDWEVFEFGSLINYIKGCPFKSADYQHTGVRIIRVSDTSFTDIKDNNPIYISDSKAKLYKPWKLQKGDLIISTVGSKPPMYDSLVGKAIKVTSKHDGSLLNQNALRVRAKSDTDGIQSLLLSHFRTERYIDFIEKIYRGNANQASITLQSLFEFKVPLPNSKKEQTAIATTLSDMDAEIQTLQQRLAKTKDIKQGMMQQLLTGKVRLAY